MIAKQQLWQRFQEWYLDLAGTGVKMDLSRMQFPESLLEEHKDTVVAALQTMQELEAGAIANPDEEWMVGHYWLRHPELAPNAELKNAILKTQQAIQQFAQQIRKGEIKTCQGATFKNVLVIGIGGSALGPQFLYQALRTTKDRLQFYFFDNTDPEGMDSILQEIGDNLSATLSLVISKSGGTKETRNGMLEAQNAYQNASLVFAQHAVAITRIGSQLDQLAQEQGWLQRFPMWDWVGGRTSVMSAVGLLPAALQGIPIDEMLASAARMDEYGRITEIQKNPAALLALMWWYTGKGRGEKAMVVLPYKDRLSSLSRYLQQLIMESLGKEKDLSGRIVQQGLTVYGNKGSTDQHAYVQQLREGANDFFVLFLEVLKDRDTPLLEVEPGITSGDYLLGFLLGTRTALYEKQRESITLIAEAVTPQTIGALIALFERAVGIYASLVGINPYHQPGVEAGKKAAEAIITLQTQLLQAFNATQEAFTVATIASFIGKEGEEEMIFKIVEHLAANGRIEKLSGKSTFTAQYRKII